MAGQHIVAPRACRQRGAAETCRRVGETGGDSREETGGGDRQQQTPSHRPMLCMWFGVYAIARLVWCHTSNLAYHAEASAPTATTSACARMCVRPHDAGKRDRAWGSVGCPRKCKGRSCPKLMVSLNSLSCSDSNCSWFRRSLPFTRALCPCTCRDASTCSLEPPATWPLYSHKHTCSLRVRDAEIVHSFRHAPRQHLVACGG